MDAQTKVFTILPWGRHESISLWPAHSYSKLQVKYTFILMSCLIATQVIHKREIYSDKNLQLETN